MCELALNHIGTVPHMRWPSLKIGFVEMLVRLLPPLEAPPPNTRTLGQMSANTCCKWATERRHSFSKRAVTGPHLPPLRLPPSQHYHYHHYLSMFPPLPPVPDHTPAASLASLDRERRAAWLPLLVARSRTCVGIMCAEALNDKCQGGATKAQAVWFQSTLKG